MKSYEGWDGWFTLGWAVQVGENRKEKTEKKGWLGKTDIEGMSLDSNERLWEGG